MGYPEKLQKLCASKGLDQSSLAARFGVSKSTISRILSGAQEPRLRFVLELASVLEVSLDDLFDDAIAIDSPVRSVALTPDEQTIVKLARRLGTERAIDRLIGAEGGGPPSGIEAVPTRNGEEPEARHEP